MAQGDEGEMIRDITRVCIVVFCSSLWLAIAGVFTESLLNDGKAKDRAGKLCVVAAITMVSAFLLICLLGIIALVQSFWG